MTMNNEAPALMPNMEGDASGFRVNTCMTAPATARDAPTAAATRTRGTRVVLRINCSLEPSKCL